jgi:hypothetical protein
MSNLDGVKPHHVHTSLFRSTFAGVLPRRVLVDGYQHQHGQSQPQHSLQLLANEHICEPSVTHLWPRQRSWLIEKGGMVAADFGR